MKKWIEIKEFNAPELDVYARLSEVQLLRYNEIGRASCRERV